MKRSRTRWLSPLPLCAALGCVTPGAYNEVVEERDRLEERVEALEASAQSLDRERAQAIDSAETLAEERARLEKSVRELERRRAELESTLAERETTLASQGEELAKLQGTYDALVSDLESEVAAGQLEIQRLREGLRLSLPSEVLFASGAVELGAEGRKALRNVAAELRKSDAFVEVWGHTDGVPVGGDTGKCQPTNWELAAARAARVVRALIEFGVDPGRLAAVSRADQEPVASNAEAQGRAQNRRIELRLVPQRVAAPPAEPPQPQEASQ
jgi:chemotaxis protein MotB